MDKKTKELMQLWVILRVIAILGCLVLGIVGIVGAIHAVDTGRHLPGAICIAAGALSFGVAAFLAQRESKQPPTH